MVYASDDIIGVDEFRNFKGGDSSRSFTVVYAAIDITGVDASIGV